MEARTTIGIAIIFAVAVLTIFVTATVVIFVDDSLIGEQEGIEFISGTGISIIGQNEPENDRVVVTITNTATTTATSTGHTILDEGVSLPDRDNLDFLGAGVTCSDATATTTECNIPGGGAATFTTKENDVLRTASTTVLDFQDPFDVSVSPAGEANIDWDSQEVTSTTWGNQSPFNWIFDTAAGGDPDITFNDDDVILDSANFHLDDGFAVRFNEDNASGSNFIGIAATSSIASDQTYTLALTGNCATNLNGGALTIDGSDNIICSDDDSGAGSDITDVGPGCTVGPCLTDTNTTTGSTLLVWEGTTSDGNDITFTITGDPATSSVFNFAAVADHEWSPITGDFTIGDADEGQIRLGSLTIGKANDIISTTVMDGIAFFYNDAASLAEDISFIFLGPAGLPRFVLAVEGPDLATYNPRSLLVGPAATMSNVDENIICSTNFNDIDCDTGATGADLGVQDDVEIGGDLFLSFSCIGGELLTIATTTGQVSCTLLGTGNIRIEEDDVSVVATTSVIDFGPGFAVSESPSNEGNITIDISEGPLSTLLVATSTDTETELEALLTDTADVFTINDCSGSTTYIDGDGACDDISNVYIDESGDTYTGIHDIGGATSLEIPNSAGGTLVNAAGEITVDTSTSTLNFYDGTAEKVLTPFMPRGLTVESATSTEDITLGFADEAVTITLMAAVIRGSGSPSITWTVKHGPDRSASGNEVVTGGTVTTSQAGVLITSFNDATIPANSFIWFETTAASVDIVVEFHVSIIWEQDAP